MKKGLFSEKKIIAIFMTAAIAAGFLESAEVSYRIKAEAKVEDLSEASGCSFIVPAGFVMTADEGVFVNEHYPLESANITYKVSYLPKEKVLTNKEKADGVSATESDEELLYDNLTKDIYEEIQKENYVNLYGEDVDFGVDSFNENTIDGYPGYMIETHLTPTGSQTVYQKIFIILSRYKAFSIIYSRADDDDFEESFAESIESIHIR